MTFSVIDHYEGFEKNNFIKRDTNQINLLNKLSLSWNYFNQNKLFFSKRKKLGVYIHGSVGSGKTFILNLFSQFTKVGKKIHFNNLMNEVHAEINSSSDKEKNLETFIKNISKNIRILFIDEMHIFNIVDALLIKKIFREKR